jgi:hypothetical protein
LVLHGSKRKQMPETAKVPIWTPTDLVHESRHSTAVTQLLISF